jgi:eukaryotic-like serine/threonine-protein kinase
MEIPYVPKDTIKDRYQILVLLGQGSMGTTYEAEDLANGNRVAIKVLSLREMREWKILELFEREARVLQNLNHSSIPKYLDFFHIDTTEDRRFYLVRELIQGESLADLVAKGWRFDEERVKQIAQQVLEILDYLHTLNPPVIHRDIKPENIIYHPEGKVFLVDFGSVQEVYRQTLMGSSTFVGTLGYMPPEQLRGKVSASSDLYGLGATLLFLLTHQSPDSLPQYRMRIDFRSHVRLSSHFTNWLEKLLEPAFEDRFSSAEEALQGLSPSSLSKIEEQYQSLTRQRITLRKTSQQLKATFPAKSRFSIPTTLLGILLLLAGVSNPGLLILLWIPGLLLLRPVISAIASIESIEINPKTFHIRRIFLGISVSHNQKPIAAIDRIELDLSLEDESSIAYFICKSEEKYPFGLALNRAEQLWLARELSSHLKKLKS